jgi:hypothetical protein
MCACAELLQQEEQKRQEVLAAQVNGKSEELELTQQMLSELLCQEDEVRLAIRLVPAPFFSHILFALSIEITSIF